MWTNNFIFLKDMIFNRNVKYLKNSSPFLFDDTTPKYHNIPHYSV